MYLNDEQALLILILNQDASDFKKCSWQEDKWQEFYSQKTS